MSGGSAIGLAAPLAVGAVLGYAAGAAVSLALTSGLTAVGSALERRQEHWERERCAEAVWEDAVAEVLTRNARIEVAKAALNAYGRTTVPLPEPLVLFRQQIDELRAWSAAADRALAVAESGLLEQDALRAAAWLTTAQPVGERPTRATPGPVTGPAPERRESARAPAPDGLAAEREAAARVLRRLTPAVTHDERLRITASAARVGAAASATEARNRLDDLRSRVDGAHAAADRRMADARAAAAFLQVLGHVQDETAAPLRETLLAVVRAQRPLEPGVRAEALRWAETVRDAAERHHVRQVLLESLREMGYELCGDFSTVTVEDGAFAVSHTSWREHEVRMIFDNKERELRAVVVRTGGSPGMDGSRADLEREEQWCGTLEDLQAQLADRGVTVDVHSLTAPGLRPTPVTSARGPGEREQWRAGTAPQAEQRGQ
ncbi:hypothetical protein [Streptomyces ortus]|uniref:Uncharacterized protein n=1 Tax=Streptomyces ortus TaxID=2867268 RepID=A0ABT3VBS2_9ACTN|nr:hypothetical protein [Streptomyces ortus]MCX4237278.1 hypothetical protein [Streptomyces ortus]